MIRSRATTFSAGAARPQQSPEALRARPGEPAKGKESFWREIFSGELFEIGLKLRPDQLRDTVNAAKDVGTGLRDVWKDLKKKVGDVLEIPQVEQILEPAERERVTEVVLSVARGLGYAAASVQGIGGAYKLVKGVQTGNTGQKLEGLFDLTTSAAVATTLAGLGIVPLVMGPVAAAMGVARGSYNAVAGFKSGDGRQEIQGMLDATRSASVGLRMLGQHVAGLGVAGAVLGPIAGAIQLSRGYYDLSTGLAKESKPKQVQGLTDIATAVGLTAALTGVGTIPGIALVAVAMGSRVLYQFNDRFEGWADRKLDSWGPSLRKVVSTVDKVIQPVIEKIRPFIESASGVGRGSEPPTPVAVGGGGG